MNRREFIKSAIVPMSAVTAGSAVGIGIAHLVPEQQKPTEREKPTVDFKAAKLYDKGFYETMSKIDTIKTEGRP